MYHAVIFNINSLEITTHKRLAGGHRIATFMREQGWDVEVIDFFQIWTRDQLRELAKSRIRKNTIFFGFSTIFNFWNDHVEEYCQWLKEKYPDVYLIAGGHSIPIGQSKFIDYYIRGYGENALLALVSSLVGNTPIGGISFDSDYGDNKVILANKTYPSYPMRSMKIIYENRDFMSSDDWSTIEFSRGCRFKCIYCSYPVTGVKDDHTRDADDALDQMRDAYDRFGITNYTCIDETFNDYTEKIIKFADTVEKLPFKPWIGGYIRADLLVSRPQDWEHLLRLGFLGQCYGIETTNPQSAKAIGKGMHPDKLLPGLLKAKEYFHSNSNNLYRGTISLIVGLPYETRESVDKTINWLVDNWQGEHFFIWPLEIPTDNKKDVLSVLSTDYEKYGYRFEEYYDRGAVDFTTSRLAWTNDYWNYSECREIVQKITTNYCFNEDYDFRPLSVFTLGIDGDSINEEIAKTKFNLFDYGKGFHQKVNDYIHKKLSL